MLCIFMICKQEIFSEKLYQDPDYDVSGLTGSCRPASGGGSTNRTNSELEYVSYSSLKPERVYFDKDAEQVFASVQAVFPDDHVSITTSSADRKIMVVSVSNTDNPGDYYLVNLNQGTVKLLFPKKPLAGQRVNLQKLYLLNTCLEMAWRFRPFLH